MTGSENNKSNKTAIAAVAAVVLVGALGMYCYSSGGKNDDYCDGSDDENDHRYYENYCGGSSTEQVSTPTPMPEATTSTPVVVSQDGFEHPKKPYTPPEFKDDEDEEGFEHRNSSVSPMSYGEMAGGNREDFNVSDYELIKNYNTGSKNIPVYNESDGQIGLPVPDMTDISAGENNKYVYDRTIGTIGFTSTKIGGRRRGQADYIRGDLKIIPDKNSQFQVSADPRNTILPGALSSSNGIGNTVDAIDAGWEYDDSVPYTRAGPQMAMNPQTIQMIEQLKAQGFSVEKIKLSLEEKAKANSGTGDVVSDKDWQEYLNGLAKQ
jgi:hypothetical protein